MKKLYLLLLMCIPGFISAEKYTLFITNQSDQYSLYIHDASNHNSTTIPPLAQKVKITLDHNVFYADSDIGCDTHCNDTSKTITFKSNDHFSIGLGYDKAFYVYKK